MNITTIVLDLAKNLFHIVGLDAHGHGELPLDEASRVEQRNVHVMPGAEWLALRTPHGRYGCPTSSSPVTHWPPGESAPASIGGLTGAF